MNFLELSIKKLSEENRRLYLEIVESYKYDCVIFVARGSYLIGKDLAELNNVPLLEIFATRKGGKLKKAISPLLCIIPKKVKIYLRKKEFNSNYHEKNFERNIKYNEEVWNKYKKCKNILIVDDSVDTGYSIKFVKEAVELYFNDANIRVATLNCFSKSKDVVCTDFYLYEDTMLKGPWSNDSSENKKYLEMYEKWHDSQG